MNRLLPSTMLYFFLAGASLAWAEEGIDFAREIRPIFVQHCVKCHGAEKQQGGLRFDTQAGAFAKADSGDAAISPGMSAKSELIRRVTSPDKSLRMPSEGPSLTDAQISALRRWIDAGAKWPVEAGPQVAGRKELVVTAEDRQHWSYLPLREVSLPAVRDAAWVRNPIDRFTLARLEKSNYIPQPPLEAKKLTRRVYFDIVGLPPETKHDEYEKLVDELLASRHFGERWARHWLDVARYADSNGQEGDQDRPTAYHFRDFVIRALNDDLPYDTFIRWQLAGDEIDPNNPLAIAATGFITAGPHTVLDVPMEDEKLRNRYNELDDMVSTFGSAMLGLTLACARCHDHKYDAIPARDYYRLMSAFHNGDRAEVPLATQIERDAFQRRRNDWDKQFAAADSKLQEWLKANRAPIESKLRNSKIDSLSIPAEKKTLLRDKPQSSEAKSLAKQHEKALAIADAEIRARLVEPQRREWDRLEKEVNDIRRKQPQALPTALAFRDFSPEPRATWLFRRGDFYDHEIPVKLGFLSVLTQSKSPEEYYEAARKDRLLAASSYQRKAIADWIVDTKEGAGALLARVMVNRIWQHYFGEGLVRTVSDFGKQGEPPSDPELLEWLANDLVANGWKIKRVHRLILISSTYRQARTGSPRRLEAEILRDAILAVSGKLNRQTYGPAFKPPIAPEAIVARNLKDGYPANIQESADTLRRSVYLFHKRVVPYPLLQTFDAPDAQQACGRRDRTTVAPQALALFNDPFVRDRAVDFADRLMPAPEKSPNWKQIIPGAYSLAFSRETADAELAASIAFLESQVAARQSRDPKASAAAIRRAALADWCQAIFSLNEFVYID